MKNKRFTLFGLLMLVLSLALSACGQDPTTKDYNGKTYSELVEEMEVHFSNVLNIYNDVQANQSGASVEDKEVIEYYEEQGYSDYEIAAVAALEEAVAEYGSYEFAAADLEDDFTVTVSGKTTTTDAVVHFGDSNTGKDVNIEVVYETWNMEITGISIDPVKTLGEKMANAGMNTLISMGIVFMVLILICLLIYAFNIFPYIEKKKAEKKKAEERKAAALADPGPQEFIPYVPAEKPAEVEVAPASDLELVAVIAAAIAASEGCSTSDFVVRSITRR